MPCSTGSTVCMSSVVTTPINVSYLTFPLPHGVSHRALLEIRFTQWDKLKPDTFLQAIIASFGIFV